MQMNVCIIYMYLLNMRMYSLVYDLRQARHEFITSIQSIGSSGRFVVCACQVNKKFVIKYSVCMASLMSIECLKVILIIYGSKIPEYYSYEREDGFKALRYVSF